jgi:hypothetical protein
MVKKRPSMSGSKHPMYGRSAIREKNMKWYNDGVNTNVFVTEGTQPQYYKAGRIIHKGNPNKRQSAESNRKNAIGHSRPVLSPHGVRFESVKAAAASVGISATAMLGRITRGVSGWKYI